MPELKRAEKNNDPVYKKATEKNLKDVDKRIAEKIAEMNIKRNEIEQSKTKIFAKFIKDSKKTKKTK